MKPKKLESKLNFKLPKRLLLKLKLTKKLPMSKLPKKLLRLQESRPKRKLPPPKLSKRDKMLKQLPPLKQRDSLLPLRKPLI